MNCYLRKIIIFNENGDSRQIEIARGLNIITGESQTGKSALIEIVDYCLGSSSSSIPVGIISDFGYLYCIILDCDTKFVVIGRKKFLQGGNKEMYLKIETTSESIKNIKFEYFKGINPLKISNVKMEISNHLGVSVMDTTEESDPDFRKGRASLRNFTPFLFQHQNLLASKHALFYRFDDYRSQQSTINEFPVFVGWTVDEYYSISRQLDEKRKELRRAEREIKKRKASSAGNYNEFFGYFKDYYALIGQSFEGSFTLKDLLQKANNLPDHERKISGSQEIERRYRQLKQEYEKKYNERNEINRKIKDLEASQHYANEYAISLKTLEKTAEKSKYETDSFTCPLCKQEHKELKQEFEELQTSKKNLKESLNHVNTYRVSYVPEIELLRKQKTGLIEEIKMLHKQLSVIEETQKEIKKSQGLEVPTMRARIRIEFKAKALMQEQEIENIDTEIIVAEIQALEKQKSRFDVKNKLEEAEVFLSTSMNRLASKLSFEKYFDPIRLWFELETFGFYHRDRKLGQVPLNEMGSGSNWLASHLSLFLSFLHFFAREDSSIVPNFLFLDQPSQIYFPHKFDIREKSSDVEKVEQIYIVILEKLDEIYEDCGILPQVIITDHADNLNLGKYSFENYVRKRWRPETEETHLI